jgi:Zn-dependent oligopeptidase
MVSLLKSVKIYLSITLMWWLTKFDNDGKSMAIYYLDFYTRDNKNGGAWMSNFVDQSHYLKQNQSL